MTGVTYLFGHKEDLARYLCPLSTYSGKGPRVVRLRTYESIHSSIGSMWWHYIIRLRASRNT